MRSSFPRARTRIAVAVAVSLAIGVLLSILLVGDQQARARTETDASVRANVAVAVTQVRTEVRDELSAAGTSTTGVTIPVAALSRSPIDPDIAINARDSGTPVLDDTARPPSIVVPIFATGPAPTTTATRRAAIEAYRVVPLSLRTVVAGLAPDGGGLVVRGPHRQVVAVPKTRPTHARTFGVDMDLTGSPGWVVQGWLPDPPTPGVTWFLVLGLLVLFAAIAAGAGLLIRREASSAARQRQLERDRTLVTGLTPVLQASLDLGEVVPAASSHLMDRLHLAGLSLSTPSDTGEWQVFAAGTSPDSRVLPTIRAPEHLESGASFALSLTRGGRVLGILRIVAGLPLTGSDLLALATASELLGSTLANAEAFSQQQDLVERMRSVDELKTVFLATASHELRTPVTAIVGFSTLLLQHWESMNNDQGRGLMDRVLSNGRRLDTLIEQLLDFSQLERGLPRTNDELLDLGRVVSRILADQPELAAGHRLEFNLAPECVVRGSTSATERIVTNLVGNAAKYSPADSRIAVTVRTDGDRVTLLVDDEGPGVPDEDRDRVFSRFYRGSGDSVTRTRGAGIGLAIVSEYAASMSGTATVQRAPSGGARFRVSFPGAGLLAAVALVEGEADVALS